MAVVDLRGVRKAYGAVEALREVTFSIGEGVTGLLGPNGAGKSTLLLCVLGLLPDWSGEASVLGLDARRQRREIRRRVGFMPEQDARLPEMTAIRAVRHLARLSGLPSAESLRRAHEVLWHVGLGEAIYRDVAEYSVGMRQRFKLAQALVHDPDLLFLDEPLSGLDPAGRDELLLLVRDLSRRHGKHVVWSSHILPEVEKVADSVVVLHRGRFRGSHRLEDLSALRGRYVVEAEGEVERFEEALSRAGFAPEEAGADEHLSLLHRRPWRVTLPPGRGVADLFRLSRLAGARVRKVAPLKEDLETVFLRLLGNRTEGGR